MATLRGDLVTLESEGRASLAACPGPPAVVTERQACFRPCLPREGAWGGLEGHDPLPPHTRSPDTKTPRKEEIQRSTEEAKSWSRPERKRATVPPPAPS